VIITHIYMYGAIDFVGSYTVYGKPIGMYMLLKEFQHITQFLRMKDFS